MIQFKNHVYHQNTFKQHTHKEKMIALRGAKELQVCSSVVLGGVAAAFLRLSSAIFWYSFSLAAMSFFTISNVVSFILKTT